MKVGLARDVISWKVGKALQMFPGTSGTSEFILLFDRQALFSFMLFLFY